MTAQAFWDDSTLGYRMAEKHLESTPTTPFGDSAAEGRGRQWQGCQGLVLLLFETALLSSGFSHENPQTHSSCIYHTIKLGLGTGWRLNDSRNHSAAVPDVMLHTPHPLATHGGWWGCLSYWRSRVKVSTSPPGFLCWCLVTFFLLSLPKAGYRGLKPFLHLTSGLDAVYCCVFSEIQVCKI